MDDDKHPGMSTYEHSRATEGATDAFATRDSRDRHSPRAADLLPSVTLPKGGGAIGGLGEKFSVAAVTGTASMSVPLALSSGRSGFTPKLALSYDSGGGNGPFGFGWNIDLPAITRKTDKGLPRYCDGEESDVFIISGAEDLVPVLDDSGWRKSVSRTLFGRIFQVYFYRPRIEALFARIERWVDSATGRTHWRSITRDNISTLYGFEPTSRVADPRDPNKVFSWRISRSWDDKGNVALYAYVAEDGVGIDVTAAHEANRSNQTRAVQRYLMTIQYGNLEPYFPDWSAQSETPLPADWMFQVILDYGNHGSSPPTPLPDQPWSLRPDPFSTYRSRFELRTYRRVQRILFFHNFPNEAVGANCLVRSLDLTYSDQLAPQDQRNPLYTFIASITQTGYRNADGTTYRRSLPPLEFEYSTPKFSAEVLALDQDSLDGLPEGLTEPAYRWVDLDGEGLSGALSDLGGSWYYKRNLSANNRVARPDGTAVTRARLGPIQPLAALPSHSNLSGTVQFMDLSGAGLADVVELSDPDPGFFKRSLFGGFEPFQRFLGLPKLDYSDPNVKFIDVTGDGLADILMTEDGLYTVFPSLGEAGFDVPQTVHTPWDEEKGPAVVFSDGTETIFVADMTGDGLNDIVRVRNGETCYWPNIGYGRFGPKVTMDRAPRFDNEERFDPKRIRLADIDGTGSNDLLYLAEDGVRAWFNQSGNAWSAANVVGVFPTADSVSNVEVIDLIGNGTACLVWSSPLPAQARGALLYVDLMGGRKPHLLVRARNNLGAETRVSYAPSTLFYLDDKAAGRPWLTRLPFPVQVVERTENIDWVGRTRAVTRYRYHHGYFDGYEREFRGFGMVEQWDTEELRIDAAFNEGGFINWDRQSWSPPMLTRTWFHTGVFEQAPAVSRQYAREYWIEPALRAPGMAGNAAAMELPDTVVPDGLNAYEIQEAYRALKGQALRIETYADDGSANAVNPYTVTEQNFTIVSLQHMGPNLHASFYVHPREKVSFNYERSTTDPSVTHDITLETDPYGNVERSVSVGYSRREGYQPPEPALMPSFQSMLAYDQGRLHIRATENQYTNAIDDLTTWPDVYRVPLPCATNEAEITGIVPTSAVNGVTNLFTFDEWDTNGGIWQQAWSGNFDIPYEAIPAADVDGSGTPAATFTRRLIKQTRSFYREDGLAAVLPLGALQTRALPGQSYEAALTPGQLQTVFGVLVTPAILAEGGYVQLPNESAWWMPSGTVWYSAGDNDSAATEVAFALAHFFGIHRAIDPFGAIRRVSYDAYDLLPTVLTDPVGNTTTAVNDYRLVSPSLVTDANGNQAAVAFDSLGMVTATAVTNKAGTLGDQLTSFTTDLDESTLVAQFVNPLANPSALIGNATTRLIFDLNAYYRTRSTSQPAPPATFTLLRENHVLGPPPIGGATSYQYRFSYSDGFGREIQRKSRCADGPLSAGGSTVSPRWIGSGWTIFNNKNQPIKQYEPFFSATEVFEFAAQAGVSSVLFYDAPGRVVATLHPDNTWEKVVFDAWLKESWDGNDTVLITDPRNDPDVGGYFQRYLGAGPAAFTSWHDLRIGGAYGATAEERAAQQDAATKTEAHANTPAISHFDALGRLSLTVVDNGDGNRFPTRTAFDTEGKPLAIIDALGRRTQEYVFRLAQPSGAFQYIAGTDMAGNGLYQINADAGFRQMLSNAAQRPIRRWDARQHAFRLTYDASQRLTHRYVSTQGAPEILLEYLVYGEGPPAAAFPTGNLRNALYRHYDMAGLLENSQYDFKGNLVAGARTIGSTYHQSVDWTPLQSLTNPSDLNAAAKANSLLSTSDSFLFSSAYDALNRNIQSVTPASSTMKPNVIQQSFDAGGLLFSVDVWLQQPSAAVGLNNPSSADRHPVTGITYNARGQRVTITYGNGTNYQAGTTTSYAYDPQTFRLIQLTTTRPSSFQANQVVQDLSYFYDPVGNITTIRDDADQQKVIFFKNTRVEPSASYTYDPLYRLIIAIGREHLGQNGSGGYLPPQQVTNDDSSRTGNPSPSDGNAMGIYTESYVYDPIGNVMAVKHQVISGSWNRYYTYSEPSQVVALQTGNRLSTTSLPGNPSGGIYKYDPHGNMTFMPHLPQLTWDEGDHLRSTTRQVFNSGTPATTYYTYDSSAQRVCKISGGQAPTGPTPLVQQQRIYVGATEVYRQFTAPSTVPSLQRETLHIMAGDQRVAIVETRTGGTDQAPQLQVRYQHGNHLNSALLELDDGSNIISYEEYFPYGSTSYQGVSSQLDLPKRYRYTGKERDTENDLYYHGARYYASWLGRWTSCDPLGITSGANSYSYGKSSPINFVDRTGMSDNRPLEDYPTARGAADKGAAAFRARNPGMPSEVQAGHKYQAKDAPESGIDETTLNSEFWKLHSRKGEGLDAKVEHQGGKISTRSRHTAMDRDLNPSVRDTAVKMAGKFDPEVHRDIVEELNWRIKNTPWDQDNIDMVRSSTLKQYDDVLPNGQAKPMTPTELEASKVRASAKATEFAKALQDADAAHPNLPPQAAPAVQTVTEPIAPASKGSPGGVAGSDSVGMMSKATRFLGAGLALLGSAVGGAQVGTGLNQLIEGKKDEGLRNIAEGSANVLSGIAAVANAALAEAWLPFSLTSIVPPRA